MPLDLSEKAEGVQMLWPVQKHPWILQEQDVSEKMEVWNIIFTVYAAQSENKNNSLTI